MASLSPEKAAEEEEKLLDDYDQEQHVPARWLSPRSWRQVALQLLPWLAHILLIATYSGIFLYYLTTLSRDVLLPTEIQSAKSIVKYETVHIKPTDFTGATRPNEFEGPPTPGRDTDAAWQHIVDVGMYSLDEEEYALFPPGVETAQDEKNPHDHIVIIDMFHQLHCLHMFRSLLYGGLEQNVYNERPDQIPLHIDHCLDYMRQIIMCHGDLNPIQTRYRPQGHPTYYPVFSTPRTCRNFDSIYEWALKGNRSGKHTEY